MTHPAFTAFLTSTCNIHPSLSERDALLNPRQGYEEEPTAAQCRKVPIGGSTSEPAVGNIYDANFMFYMLPSAVVKQGDRIVHNGSSYIVMGVEEPEEVSSVHHKEVFCKSTDLNLQA